MRGEEEPRVPNQEILTFEEVQEKLTFLMEAYKKAVAADDFNKLPLEIREQMKKFFESIPNLESLIKRISDLEKK